MYFVDEYSLKIIIMYCCFLSHTNSGKLDYHSK